MQKYKIENLIIKKNSLTDITVSSILSKIKMSGLYIFDKEDQLYMRNNKEGNIFATPYNYKIKIFSKQNILKRFIKKELVPNDTYETLLFNRDGLGFPLLYFNEDNINRTVLLENVVLLENITTLNNDYIAVSTIYKKSMNVDIDKIVNKEIAKLFVESDFFKCYLENDK